MDTLWIRSRIAYRCGTVEAFADDMRDHGHRTITAEALEDILDGKARLWSEEAALIAKLIDARTEDVADSLWLARVHYRWDLADSGRLQTA